MVQPELPKVGSAIANYVMTKSVTESEKVPTFKPDFDLSEDFEE
jgi:hypothetical protein